jgi:formate dehydrogenase subunit gamma
MTTAVERFDEGARRRFGRYGRTVVYEGQLLRHPVYTRFLHWSVAVFFILSLLSGLAIYTPYLYHWIAPLFGGGPTTRLLHPWFSLLFVAFFALQMLNWLRPMTWTESDRRWLGRMKEYVSNTEKLEPQDVGFFNGGQKVYFWAVAVCALVFLITGFVMWLPHTFGRITMAVSYVLHDIAALVMLGGFIIHLYEGTAAQPGTFHSMTRGTVTEAWAWTHHPAWYRDATGRDPRQDYDRARQRRTDRTRAGEAPAQGPVARDRTPMG